MQDDLTELIIIFVVVNPAQIHGWFATSNNGEAVGAEVGVRSIAGIERDPDLLVARVHKLEFDVGILSPLRSELLHLVLKHELASLMNFSSLWLDQTCCH